MEMIAHHRRHYLSIALALTTLLVGAGPGAASAVAARTTAGGTRQVSSAEAVISIAPNVARTGGRVLVSGAGFAAGEAVQIHYQEVPSVTTVGRAGAGGLLPATPLAVPVSFHAGPYIVVATGAVSKRAGRAVVTVVAAPTTPTATVPPRPTPTAPHTPTARPTATPSHTPTPPHTPTPRPIAPTRPAATPVVRAAIAVAPAVVARGGTVTVSGGGFAASELVLIYFNAASQQVTTARATAAGLLPATAIRVPASLTAGSHRVTALGATSKRAAVASVTVVVPVPAATPTPRPTPTRVPIVPPPAVRAAIAVVPALVNRGGLVTVSGAGFRAGEVVTIYFVRAPRQVTTARATAAGLLPATGVTVPYALPVGTEPLVALGTASRRSATGTVTVQALTPSLSLVPTTASPGTVVTVSGRGFGAGERITLALNGAAVATRPAVVTTADGAFTALFTAPSTLVDGPNTVDAIGNLSRVAAVAALGGVLPVSARFYFAGGLNTATEHSSIDLLNANGQPTTVRLTFYFDNGATAEKTVAVAPASEAVVPAASLGLPAGTFGLYVTANRRITAQITTARDGRDGDTLLGNTGLGTRWYLAEGYTGLTFHETVSILNPDPATPAHVQLQLLPFGGRAGKSVAVTVAPHSNGVTDINSQLPGQSLSVIAVSDRPVVVERTMTFSNGGYGMTTRAGANSPATNWLFAEGTTVNRFQTYLTILNPNTVPARVTASFFGQVGGSLGSKTIVVAGLSRANLKLNDFLSASGIASVLTSDLPIVVERPEYFGSPNDAGVAGSDVFGLNGAGVRWSFPGGDTGGLSEFLLVYNPSPLPVTLDVDLYGSDGRRLTRRVSVPPTVRYNININTLAPGFAPLHGAILRPASGQGFIAEQTIFAPNYTTLRSTQGLAQ